MTSTSSSTQRQVGSSSSSSSSSDASVLFPREHQPLLNLLTSDDPLTINSQEQKKHFYFFNLKFDKIKQIIHLSPEPIKKAEEICLILLENSDRAFPIFSKMLLCKKDDFGIFFLENFNKETLNEITNFAKEQNPKLKELLKSILVIMFCLYIKDCFFFYSDETLQFLNEYEKTYDIFERIFDIFGYLVSNEDTIPHYEKIIKIFLHTAFRYYKVEKELSTNIVHQQPLLRNICIFLRLETEFVQKLCLKYSKHLKKTQLGALDEELSRFLIFYLMLPWDEKYNNILKLSATKTLHPQSKIDEFFINFLYENTNIGLLLEEEERKIPGLFYHTIDLNDDSIVFNNHLPATTFIDVLYKLLLVSTYRPHSHFLLLDKFLDKFNWIHSIMLRLNRTIDNDDNINSVAKVFGIIILHNKCAEFWKILLWDNEAAEENLVNFTWKLLNLKTEIMQDYLMHFDPLKQSQETIEHLFSYIFQSWSMIIDDDSSTNLPRVFDNCFAVSQHLLPIMSIISPQKMEEEIQILTDIINPLPYKDEVLKQEKSKLWDENLIIYYNHILNFMFYFKNKNNEDPFVIIKENNNFLFAHYKLNDFGFIEENDFQLFKLDDNKKIQEHHRDNENNHSLLSLLPLYMRRKTIVNTLPIYHFLSIVSLKLIDSFNILMARNNVKKTLKKKSLNYLTSLFWAYCLNPKQAVPNDSKYLEEIFPTKEGGFLFKHQDELSFEKEVKGYNFSKEDKFYTHLKFRADKNEYCFAIKNLYDELTNSSSSSQSSTTEEMPQEYSFLVGYLLTRMSLGLEKNNAFSFVFKYASIIFFEKLGLKKENFVNDIWTMDYGRLYENYFYKNGAWRKEIDNAFTALWT